MQHKPGTIATALWSAAAEGDVATVARLVEEGADVNVWNQQGLSALSFAAANGQLDVAILLLRAGAWVDPHEDYDVYMSPLALAAEFGHIEIVRLLLAEGAEPCLHVGVGQMTAEYYARSRFTEISNLLREAEDRALRNDSSEQTR